MLGEAVTHLPGLSPCAASLVAMARAPADEAWAEARADPGAVLLLLRHAAPSLASPSASSFPALLDDPLLLEKALRQLHDASLPQHRHVFVDWNGPVVRPVYESCWLHARLAERLAVVSNLASPVNAWVAGLLAGLGWLAVCAVSPERVSACLADPYFAADPTATQQAHWGLDQAALARRLAQAWRLPPWLAAVAGHLALPVAVARRLGADPDLFQIVQLAAGLARQHGSKVWLPAGADPPELAAALGLSDADREAVLHVCTAQPDPPRVWQSPHAVPLLPDLLRLAVENRRLLNAPAVVPLQSALDQMQQALVEQRAEERRRLLAQKLSALAEFAAGAGHEINNPLAVISGQAQYLLNREEEPERQRSLRTIIGQTQRIHQLLNELMQFARPPRPQLQVLAAAELISAAAAALADLALQRRIRLLCPEPAEPVYVLGDPRQVQTALNCLLRNAVEAAPAGGWAGIRLERPAADRIELIVEDNGGGLTAAQREHLFDPFYSGRSAGRGRGLGLPTAWRLARENGGDVRFDDRSIGPTRFVLSLCRAAPPAAHCPLPAAG